ncbi:GAF domain-containing protein [Hymenobacter sp. 5317J-9]|uniref:GAF domain-containing protein n=1 Tax=Hymenobacter sp. 5317J-9 TaxID=2932250 RepID=UPI001FD6BF23|nr:GAF domain-containing protein [Hymenobacter sp. 5317J-9]UOQ99168.1 GAF domain-containing protein [Hymenobacter sp. 5317J-9]
MNPLLASLIPANDDARLRALDRYQLLDARSEKILDDVVATTARLFRVSNALISIVEKDTVLVKAPYNLPEPIERVPREQSLCSATILRDDTTVFENLEQSSAPGVDISLVRRMGLRFYAGHTLRTPDGHSIGALCLLDGPPRRFTSSERSLLGHLAGLVTRLLELRRVLGAHAGATVSLWELVYRAISEQLGRLGALAERVMPDSPSRQLSPAVAQEAGAIVGIIDQFLVATLRRP